MRRERYDVFCDSAHRLVGKNESAALACIAIAIYNDRKQHAPNSASHCNTTKMVWLELRTDVNKISTQHINSPKLHKTFFG